MAEYFQRSIRMDSDTEAEIQEIANKDDRKWSEVAFNLIKQQLKERRRLLEKSRSRKSVQNKDQ
jgi:predicted transcriptional regulator